MLCPSPRGFGRNSRTTNSPAEATSPESLIRLTPRPAAYALSSKNKPRGLLILLLTAAILGFAQEYPRPSGYVNDFAHVLSSGVAESLNQELAAFREQTSIEIAVVTVNSLQGESIEDYTRGLAAYWGVGERGRNNGVVFLVAPTARKMRIETASGVQPVLTDNRADAIRDSVILPRFRAGDIPGGILDGTRAIMSALKENAQPPSDDATSTARKFPDTWFLAGIAALVVLLLVIVPPIRRSNARHFVLADQGAFARELTHVEGDAAHPDVMQHTRALLAALKDEFAASSIPWLTSAQGNIDWVEASKTLHSFYKRLRRIATTIRDEITVAARARTEGAKLLNDLPGMLDQAEAKLGNGKQSTKAAEQLAEAREKYRQAQARYADTGDTDWLFLYPLLIESQQNCARAETIHQQVNTDSSFVTGAGGFDGGGGSGGGGAGSDGGGGFSGGGGFDGGGSSGSW
jgi:uncharacterized protein